jgi:hypothetical protein
MTQRASGRPLAIWPALMYEPCRAVPDAFDHLLGQALAIPHVPSTSSQFGTILGSLAPLTHNTVSHGARCVRLRVIVDFH